MEKKKMKVYQVHLSEAMYLPAQQKAEAMGLSFAAYVRTLIAKDLTPLDKFPSPA